MNPTDVVQVCTPDLSQCQWVPVSEFSPIPHLSIEEAQILAAAFWGLLAVAFVWRKLQSTFPEK